MTAVVLDTVYKVLERRGSSATKLNPSFIVDGASDTVDVYLSNAIAKPANAAAMTIDSSDITGTKVMLGSARWILWTGNTGTPTVTTKDMLEGTT